MNNEKKPNGFDNYQIAKMLNIAAANIGIKRALDILSDNKEELMQFVHETDFTVGELVVLLTDFDQSNCRFQETVEALVVNRKALTELMQETGMSASNLINILRRACNYARGIETLVAQKDVVVSLIENEEAV